MYVTILGGLRLVAMQNPLATPQSPCKGGDATVDLKVGCVVPFSIFSRSSASQARLGGCRGRDANGMDLFANGVMA